MSLTDQIHKGMVIRHNGQVFAVEDYKLTKSGKQKPTVHVKLRSLRDGHSSDRTLDELGRIEEVEAATRDMQYLYNAGKEHVFMDTETFEQHAVDQEVLGPALDFMLIEENYPFMLIEGQVARLKMPETVILEVVETAPVEHAGGHSSVQKEATLSTGFVAQVPLFIKNGDKIRVNTQTREYLGKEH